jgi:hypothetical protein
VSVTIGRPHVANPRRNAVPVRLADDELDTIRAAAQRAGLTVGEWSRNVLLRAAKRQR